MENSFFKVLNNREFKLIWISQVFSQIALNIITYALVLHIYDLTGKATSISLVLFASAIAVAVFGPFSGVLADKMDCRKILIYTNLLRFVSAVILMMGANNVLAILEIMFIISALAQIFTPAESSSLPVILHRDQLVAANSTVMTTTYATLLFGYCISGPLLNYLGPSWLFFICSLLFLIAAWATFQLSNYDRKKIERRITFISIATGVERVWEEAKLGLRYLKKSKDVLNPMLKLTICWAILGSFITILPAYGTDVLKANPKLAGPLIIIPVGIGMIVAALYLNKGKKKFDSTILNTGFLIAGLPLLIFSLYPLYSGHLFSYLILGISILLIGFGWSIIQIPAQTLLQLNSEEDKRGRVFGFSAMQLRFATAIPALFIGGLADLTSTFFTVVLLALIATIYSFLLFFKIIA